MFCGLEKKSVQDLERKKKKEKKEKNSSWRKLGWLGCQSINCLFVAITTQFQLISSRKSKNKRLVKKQLEKI